MEVQHAAHGFTAASIQSRGRILLPHASRGAIPSLNGDLHGPSTGVFSTIALRQILKVARGPSGRNTSGGTRSSANGLVTMCLISRSPGHPTTHHLLVQLEWMLNLVLTRSL